MTTCFVLILINFQKYVQFPSRKDNRRIDADFHSMFFVAFSVAVVQTPTINPILFRQLRKILLDHRKYNVLHATRKLKLPVVISIKSITVMICRVPTIKAKTLHVHVRTVHMLAKVSWSLERLCAPLH